MHPLWPNNERTWAKHQAEDERQPLFVVPLFIVPLLFPGPFPTRAKTAAGPIQLLSVERLRCAAWALPPDPSSAQSSAGLMSRLDRGVGYFTLGEGTYLSPPRIPRLRGQRHGVEMRVHASTVSPHPLGGKHSARADAPLREGGSQRPRRDPGKCPVVPWQAIHPPSVRSGGLHYAAPRL